MVNKVSSVVKVIYLLAFVLPFLGSTPFCYSQEIDVLSSLKTLPSFVQSAPNATLYEMKDSKYYTPSCDKRELFDVSTLTQKRVRKPTELEVINIVNMHKVAEFDSYVVKVKDKYYLISSTDIGDNTWLENLNKNLMNEYARLKDSVSHYTPTSVYQQLLNLTLSRIRTSEDSLSFLKQNTESVLASKARVLAKHRIQKNLLKYKERREKYSTWVSSLPSFVQKDAEILVIPNNTISVGYFGACEYLMSFINMSANKTIKYLTWSGVVKNAVGDYISCEVRHTSSFSGKYTGPCGPLSSDSAEWSGVLFNTSADMMVLTSVKIIYTDGSSVTIGRKSLDYLTNIPQEMFYDELGLTDYDFGYNYEGLDNLDNETKNELLLSKYRLRDEFEKDIERQVRTVSAYKSMEYILTKKKDDSYAVYTYLQDSAPLILTDDPSFIRVTQDYHAALMNYNKAKRNLTSFEKKYFGFLEE